MDYWLIYLCITTALALIASLFGEVELNEKKFKGLKAFIALSIILPLTLPFVAVFTVLAIVFIIIVLIFVILALIIDAITFGKLI